MRVLFACLMFAGTTPLYPSDLLARPGRFFHGVLMRRIRRFLAGRQLQQDSFEKFVGLAILQASLSVLLAPDT